MIEILDTIRQTGGELRVKAPKGLLSSAERRLLAEHKAEVVKLLATELVVEDQVVETLDFGEAIDPSPCPRCGLLEMWQTAAGTWRCLRCDPPKAAIRLLERVQRIRRRSGLPARPETATMLADLCRLTSQVVRARVAAAVVGT